ncbi:tetratricopeptide repeat protein [Pontibacter sp. E15-1]|uniref:tetratricopeptide repeat protein n=1 Tax=Pontibacter sp. E15-1 TaxID=2919918 RepID=UPI001F4F5029|nr:tetratricopeptide repeat protein [Pontibacter sp. E15-1]MCJ8166249.1 tetratricopeptide repeat protein [Pontibacter sp. E15-1]
MVDLQQVKNDPEAQLSHLTVAIGQSGKDGSLYARRALVLLRKGQLPQALEDADEAVRLTQNEPSSLFVKAQVLRALGKPDEALPLALLAERNSYQSASLYVLLGELYLQRKQYEQSRMYMTKAHELAPTDEFAFYYKGRIATATGDTARALKNYRLALQQAPKFMEAQRELGGLLVNRHEYEEAKQLIASAQKAAPQDGLLWFYKGTVLQAEQKQDSALQAYERAVSFADTIAGAHYWLGLRQYALGQNDVALEHLQKAAPAYGAHPKYLSTLANAYERTGQNRAALATYQRLLQVAPSYTYANQAIYRLRNKIAKPMPDSTVVRQAQTEQ